MSEGTLRTEGGRVTIRLKDAQGGAVAKVVAKAGTPLPRENDRLLRDDRGFNRRLVNMGDGTHAEVFSRK